MSSHASNTSLSIPKLRNLILVCLVLGLGAFTAVMFSIAQQLSSRFGPQVENDLRWRVSRGAHELARASEVGLAVGDEAVVRSEFGVYARSEDVQAIVAMAADGRVIAQHGKPPEAGRATVRRKAAWPRWTPTRDMIARDPQLQRWAGGMEPGPGNPLGARALYLYEGGVDTLYRLHGTNEPWSIGQAVSSGCVRLLNIDIIDLYERVPIGTEVVVLQPRPLLFF
jgi:lipoprotein-anchoring transpeptidase ErfK/SrfK